MKFEAHIRARRIHEDTWLNAMKGFMSDEVLYTIDDKSSKNLSAVNEMSTLHFAGKKCQFYYLF
jgi:hypothetical protein